MDVGLCNISKRSHSVHKPVTLAIWLFVVSNKQVEQVAVGGAWQAEGWVAGCHDFYQELHGGWMAEKTSSAHCGSHSGVLAAAGCKLWLYESKPPLSSLVGHCLCYSIIVQ